MRFLARTLSSAGRALPRAGLVAMSLWLGAAAGEAQQPSQRPPVDTAPPAARAFQGTTVIDVATGRRLPNQTIVVVGNRIEAIGPAGRMRLPAGAQVVRAEGTFAIPGLWDMHAHPMYETDIYYPLFLANGVTGIRDPGSPWPLDTLTRWKREIAAGTRLGPRFVTSGPSIFECSTFLDMLASGPGPGIKHTICISTPADARRVVDSLKAAGADFIKPHGPGMGPELLLPLMAEARRVGLPVGGHFDGLSGEIASDSGARFLDHITWFRENVCADGDQTNAPPALDSIQCAAMSARLRRNGTWVVETPIWLVGGLFPHLEYERWRRYVRPSPLLEPWRGALTMRIAARDSLAPALPKQPASLADWKAVLQSAYGRSGYSPIGPNSWNPASTDGKMRVRNYAVTRGLPLLAGTDVAPPGFESTLIPGFSLHETLASFVLGGMTPLEALRTATLEPARALRATDSLGTIAAGKLADLVLLEADPLEDIWNTTKIRAVVANGRYFDRAALDALLTQAERAAHR